MKRFKNKKIDILIDADGSCFTHEYPLIGRDIGAQLPLKELTQKGHRLILFTMRSDFQLVEAVEWFKLNEIPLFGIQTNPEQRSWTASPKAYGQYIIDDTCAFMPLKTELPHDRLFIDWIKMRKELVRVGLL